MISVLIVEDEPLIAEAHRTYLQRLTGFSVAAVAHTARDAMRAATDAAANETPIEDSHWRRQPRFRHKFAALAFAVDLPHAAAVGDEHRARRGC